VPDDLESTLVDLRRKGDQALLEFLRNDLNLGLTFARLAQIEEGLDEPASKQALLHAQRAIETVKHFRSRINYEGQALEIDERLAELERLVSALF